MLQCNIDAFFPSALIATGSANISVIAVILRRDVHALRPAVELEEYSRKRAWPTQTFLRTEEDRS
jgi:hypothetical protein